MIRPWTEFDPYAGNDTANAARFAFLHGGHVRWVEEYKTWFVYDKVRWNQGAAGQVWAWATDVGKQIILEEVNEPDMDKRKLLLKRDR